MTRYICYICICFTFLLEACQWDKVDSIAPATSCTTIEADTISFNKQIVPIFLKNCSIAGCHSGNAPESNFNLDAAVAYKTLTKKGYGYIDTINPEKSVLYSSLVSVDNPMPPNGKLGDCDIKLITLWMHQKAENN